MSGQSGSPQNDPPDSEGVQPMESEGVQHQQGSPYVNISPNSLVTPGHTEGLHRTPDTPTPLPTNERVQGHVTSNTLSDWDPTPNTPRWGTVARSTDHVTQASGETNNEQVQDHVTPNTAANQTDNMQIECVQPEGTTGQSTSAKAWPTNNPSTPVTTAPPTRMIPLPYEPGQTILGRTRHGADSPLDYVSIGSDPQFSPSPVRQPK